MNYEPIIDHLKAARLAASVSQRELSRRTGITQSHISLIENGAVEPGLPSIIQIARALELELVVVPKKLVPAVNGIIRGNEPSGQLTPEQGATALKQLQRGQRLVVKLTALYGTTPDLERIATTLRDMQRLNLRPEEVRDVGRLIDDLKRYQTSPQAASDVRRIVDALRRLRNTVVHQEPEAPRPAYAGDEEEEEDNA
jgi:transcriptional regulator with XRE-family HTH domain